MPQLAVGAGKVIAALLLVVPPVPLLADVLPADCVPAQLANEEVMATRAYDPPVTSVPLPVSPQATVSRPTYQVAGILLVWPRNTASSSLFSPVSVHDAAIANDEITKRRTEVSRFIFFTFRATKKKPTVKAGFDGLSVMQAGLRLAQAGDRQEWQRRPEVRQMHSPLA